jgi:hypothetical protein
VARREWHTQQTIEGRLTGAQRRVKAVEEVVDHATQRTGAAEESRLKRRLGSDHGGVEVELGGEHRVIERGFHRLDLRKRRQPR